MDTIAKLLTDWGETLCPSVDVGGLITRNEVVHKWKAPFRSLLVREGVCWRTHDLLQQSHLLHASGHILGARILLRGAFETLAVLVYLNQLMRNVVAETLDYHQFCAKTSQLALGSKDGSTAHSAVNVLTVLDHCEKRFPGIRAHYDILSESAHPNFEGICLGYSKADRETFVTTFVNRWADLYGASHESGIRACMAMFTFEYNNEWPEAFRNLETWMEANDAKLEESKSVA